MIRKFRNHATGETIILDEIDGKDVDKVAIGAALGIGGMLALRGLFSFIARD